jgi:hypothetical protein
VEAPAHSGRARTIALLVVVAVAPYIATLAFGYIYDDTTILRSNPRIQGWSSLLSLWTQPYWSPNAGAADQSGLYRPVFMAALSAIWNGIGHAPIWFHCLVVAMHAAATVAVWRLVSAAVSRRAALVGALWFAVQSVHVEAVANIANSSEVAVALWVALLALYLQRVTRRGAEALSWRGAMGAGVIYLAACLTKESGFVAPALALLWLWGWTPAVSGESLAESIRRAARLWWRAIVVFFGVLVIVGIVRARVLGGLVSGHSIGAPGIDTLSGPARVWAMLALGPRIAALLLWTPQINPHYGPTTLVAHPAPRALATIVVLIAAIVVATARARRGERRWLAAICFIGVAFLPASNLLAATGQILAERTLYVASIGVAMLVALAADATGQRITRPSMRTFAAVCAGVIIAMQGVRTFRFARSWSTHERLFGQMIAADPAGYRGYWLLGMAERNGGAPDSALVLLGRAYAIDARDRQLSIDYAETLMQQDLAVRAADVSARLMTFPDLRQKPEAVSLYLNSRGRAYGPDSVIAAGRRLFDSAPSTTAALFVGTAYEVKGDRAAALAMYRAGLRVAPMDAELLSRVHADPRKPPP